MANSKFEKLIEYIVNEEEDKARALFHDIVVEKSRSIYENIIDEEGYEEEDMDDLEDDINGDEEGLSLEDFEMEDDEDYIGGDEQDDMVGDVDAGDDFDDGDDDEVDVGGEDEFDYDDDGELDDHEDDHEEVTDRVSDLEDAMDELKADFDKIMSGEDDGEEEEDDDDEEVEEGEDFFEEDDLEEGEDEDDDEDLNEYVDKVNDDVVKSPVTKGEESFVNKKSSVAGKNDMGGSAKNIAQSEPHKGGHDDHGSMQSNSPKEVSDSFANEPGIKKSDKHHKMQPGHGAEKKGKPEKADNKTSTIGSKSGQGKS